MSVECFSKIYVRFSVEQYLPGLVPIESPAVEVVCNEFWAKIREPPLDAMSHLPRAQQWDSELQHQLQLTISTGQTLCLRFYSDLEDAKSRHDMVQDANEPLHKNNSLSWALTITRFCGPDQLKQPLPNFGKDNNAELMDLLNSNHHNNDSSKERRNETLRRQRSSSPRKIFYRSSSLPFFRGNWWFKVQGKITDTIVYSSTTVSSKQKCPRRNSFTWPIKKSWFDWEQQNEKVCLFFGLTRPRTGRKVNHFAASINEARGQVQ